MIKKERSEEKTMSQEKVDRYKKEKKNRSKVMKHRRIRKTIIVSLITIVLAAGIGALIGIPLGRKIYRDQKKKEKAKSVISTAEFSSWFDYNWVENHSDVFVGMDFVSNTEEPSEASGNDAEPSSEEAPEAVPEGVVE